MPHRSWTFLGNGDVSDYRVFRLRRDRYRFEQTGEERDFVVIDSASWVNIVPVTTEGNVVLVRQFRHGIQDVVLEIPGGMIDGDESPADAAARELREETGYVAEKITLSYMRHNDKWFRLPGSLTADECLDAIENDGNFQLA